MIPESFSSNNSFNFQIVNKPIPPPRISVSYCLKLPIKAMFEMVNPENKKAIVHLNAAKHQIALLMDNLNKSMEVIDFDNTKRIMSIIDSFNKAKELIARDESKKPLDVFSMHQIFEWEEKLANELKTKMPFDIPSSPKKQKLK